MSFEFSDPRQRSSKDRLGLSSSGGTETPDTPIEDRGLGAWAADAALDVPRGIGRGLLGFGESLAELADSGAELVGGDLFEGDLGWNESLGENRTWVGDVTEGVTQFAAGFVPIAGALGKLSQVKNVGKVGSALRWFGQLKNGGFIGRTAFSTTAGAIADSVAWSSHEQRLSDLIEQYPALRNPITDFLSSDVDDSVAEARMKTVLEGMALGPIGDVIATALGGSLRVLRAGPEQAEAVAKTVAPDIEAAIARLDEDLPEGIKLADESPRTFELTKEKRDKLSALIQAGVKDDLNLFEMEKLFKNSDFNLDRLLIDNGTADVFGKVSDVLKEEFNSLKGGVEKLSKTRAKALETIGSDLEDTLDLPGGALLNRLRQYSGDATGMASDLIAGKMILSTQAENLNRIGSLIKAGTASDKQKAQFLVLVEDMSELAGNLKALQTAAARTTSAGRIAIDTRLSAGALEDMILAAGGDRRLADFAEQMSLAGGNPHNTVKAIQSRWHSGFRKAIDVHNEIWINSILSGPVTHTVNLLSTAAHGMMMSGEKLIGGVLGADMKSAREGADQIVGSLVFLKDAVKMMARSGFTGDGVLEAGHRTVDAPMGAIRGNTKTNAIPELLSSTAKSIKDRHGVGKSALDWLGSVVRLPGRLLGAEDELFKQLNYRSFLYAKGMQDARSRGIASMADRIAHAKQFVEKSIGEGGRAKSRAALEYAREATFTADLEYGLGRTIQRGMATHPGLRVVMPFVRTPTNIMRQLWRRTPGINILQRQFIEDLTSKDASRRALARGQLATGAILASSAYMAMSAGRITGGGPNHPDARRALMDTGWQPYSIRIGDKYVSYKRIEPWGSIFGIIADFGEISAQAEDQDRDQLGLSIVAALAKNITSKTYLAGLSEAVDVLTDPERNLWSWWHRQVGSYVPNFLRQTNDDPHYREIRSVLDSVKSRLPGWSETLDPQRNIYGEAITIPAGFGPDDLSPFYQTADRNDAARSEIARLGYGFRLPSKTQFGVNLQDFTARSGYTSYDRLLELHQDTRIGGKTLAERLNEIVKSEQYKRLPADAPADQLSDHPRVKMIRSVLRSYKDASLQRLLKEQPELIDTIKTAARQRRTALAAK